MKPALSADGIKPTHESPGKKRKPFALVKDRADDQRRIFLFQQVKQAVQVAGMPPADIRVKGNNARVWMRIRDYVYRSILFHLNETNISNAGEFERVILEVTKRLFCYSEDEEKINAMQ